MCLLMLLRHVSCRCSRCPPNKQSVMQVHQSKPCSTVVQEGQQTVPENPRSAHPMIIRSVNTMHFFPRQRPETSLQGRHARRSPAYKKRRGIGTHESVGCSVTCLLSYQYCVRTKEVCLTVLALRSVIEAQSMFTRTSTIPLSFVTLLWPMGSCNARHEECEALLETIVRQWSGYRNAFWTFYVCQFA